MLKTNYPERATSLDVMPYSYTTLHNNVHDWISNKISQSTHKKEFCENIVMMAVCIGSFASRTKKWGWFIISVDPVILADNELLPSCFHKQKYKNSRKRLNYVKSAILFCLDHPAKLVKYNFVLKCHLDIKLDWKMG